MFAREAEVGVLTVLDDRSSFPPSRITDLRASVNPSAMQVTLRWTAPGKQLDHGNGECDWENLMIANCSVISSFNYDFEIMAVKGNKNISFVYFQHRSMNWYGEQIWTE